MVNRQQRKLKRLLNITALLLESRKPLNAEEILELLDDDAYSGDKKRAALRRTFERDKQDLLEIGVPLEVRKWDFGDPSVDHYFIDPAVYSERDVNFKTDELAALHLATWRVNLPGSDDAFVKTGIPSEEELRAVDPPSHRSRQEAVVSLPFDKTNSKLASAAAKRMAVSFDYRRADGTELTRQVEPWRLSFTRGHWYLVGWDRSRSGERLFRVDRLREPVIETSRAVEPVGEVPDLAVMRPWNYGHADPFEARVLVDASRAEFAANSTGDEGERQPDGSVVLTLSVRNPAGLRSFVLGLLEHAEVIEPKWMRQEVVDWLQALAQPAPAQEAPTQQAPERPDAVRSGP